MFSKAICNTPVTCLRLKSIRVEQKASETHNVVNDYESKGNLILEKHIKHLEELGKNSNNIGTWMLLFSDLKSLDIVSKQGLLQKLGNIAKITTSDDGSIAVIPLDVKVHAQERVYRVL